VVENAQTTGAFLITFAVLQTVFFLLLVRFLDLYEHEPLSTLALMTVWGAVGATALSAVGNQIGNQILEGFNPDFADVFGPAIAAPTVEEVAKGMALVGAFVFSAWAHKSFGTKRLRGLTDGLVYGAAVGLGFAFTEDVKYLFDVAASGDFAEGVSVFAGRRDFIGLGMLQHAIFTGMFGVGVGLATWARRWWWKGIMPILGLATAILLHAFNNGFVEFRLAQEHGLEMTRRFVFTVAAAGLKRAERSPAFGPDIVDSYTSAVTFVRIGNVVIFIALMGLAAWWLAFQRKVIRQELPEEVDKGLINGRDWELVPSFGRRLMWYLDLIRVKEFERVRVFRKLHIELANLALLKWRNKGWGLDEKEMQASRQRVATMKAEAKVDVYAPP